MINASYFAAESAAVTNWPVRLLLVGVMFAALGLVFFRMKRRWDHLKSASEATLPLLVESAPSNFVAEKSIDGLFIGTSPEGDWMRRVMSQGLGVRSRSQLQWDRSGIYFARTGEPSFYIANSQILDVQFGRGVAGTVRAKDSVMVVRWRLGESILDSGFRADTAPGHASLIDFKNMLSQVNYSQSQVSQVSQVSEVSEVSPVSEVIEKP